MTAHFASSADFDAVIVGARCAGAATAMLLARRGLRVLVVDRAHYGTDTLSTHALMRAGVLQLHRWGVLDGIKSAGTPAVRMTSFHYGDEIVDVPIKPQNGVEGLYAPRRTVIDPLLVDHARRAGAEVEFSTQLVDLVRTGDGRVCGVRVRRGDGSEVQITADLVIGADGVRSTVARLAGAEHYRTGRHATGVIFSYWSGTGFDGYHWYYRPGVSAGVIPTNEGLACIFVSIPQGRFHEALRVGTGDAHRQLLRECGPDSADVVEGASRVEKYRGFGERWDTSVNRRALAGLWLGRGVFQGSADGPRHHHALIDAELLAKAAAVGEESALAGYQIARDKRSGLFDVTDAVASFDWDLPKASSCIGRSARN